MQTVIQAARRPLTVALFVALLAPGLAFADTAKERELEARVAQLESQVRALLAAQQQTQTQLADTKIQLDAVDARHPAPPAGKQGIQVVSITPGSPANTTFRFGGFVKGDYLMTKTDEGQLASDASGRMFYVPGQTPVGTGVAASAFDTNFHAKSSRLNFGVDTVGENGSKAGAFVEFDFFGNALGTQTATNTYGAVVRHAYAYWNNWMAGQTWSNFMDPSALPESVDYIGPTDGLIFVRQAQVRYTKGGFSASLENPETVTFGLSDPDRGALPDLTVRYGWKGDWGTFGIGGLLRQLKVDANSIPGADDSAVGFGLTVGGKWVAGANDTLFYQLTGGTGISRYIALAAAPDAVWDPIDHDLDTTTAFGGYVGWRHAFSPKLRTNLIFSRSDYNNDDLFGAFATSRVQSIRGNIFYTPFPKVDVGAELMFGKRELENGLDGDITRLQFTTKYSF